MSKTTKINGDLIKSSGEKLIMVGYLMIGSIGFSILYFLIISNSRDIDEIQSMGVIAAIISVILTILIIKNIIQSGFGFIESVETDYNDGVNDKYDSNGNLKEQITYKDGQQDASVKYFHYDNGQLEKIETHKDGRKDGIWEEYYSNGQLKSKGTFNDGKPDGLWEYYKQDGTLNTNLSGHYVNSKRVRPL